MEIESLAFVHPEDIHTRPPFSDLFRKEDSVLEGIRESMGRNGYDEAHPVHIWRQENCLVDGHSRVAVAADLGLDVAAYFHDFPDEDAALDYAIRCQRDRRNLTDGEIYSLTKLLDKRKRQGERTDLVSSETKLGGQSADTTAEKIGTSKTKVNKARSIEPYPDLVKAVERGKLSLNQADKEARRRRREKREADAQSLAADPLKAEPEPSFCPPPTEGPAPEFVADPLASISAEDAAIVGGVPLYAKVGNHYLRDDVMIHHRILPKIRSLLNSIIGMRAIADMSHLHRQLDRLCKTPPPTAWKRCSDCEGKASKGICKPCKGTGFTIPASS